MTLSWMDVVPGDLLTWQHGPEFNSGWFVVAVADDEHLSRRLLLFCIWSTYRSTPFFETILILQLDPKMIDGWSRHAT